jgi:hypothetical protein
MDTVKIIDLNLRDPTRLGTISRIMGLGLRLLKTKRNLGRFEISG